ncbi:MAG: hypothetical protein Q7R98_02025 [Candidatus Jorgensenbacteria bacterium]|nr:hypothetical protein [Candidatus Jorgensenbacteria bacterium]
MFSIKRFVKGFLRMRKTETCPICGRSATFRSNLSAPAMGSSESGFTGSIDCEHCDEKLLNYLGVCPASAQTKWAEGSKILAGYGQFEVNPEIEPSGDNQHLLEHIIKIAD